MVSEKLHEIKYYLNNSFILCSLNRAKIFYTPFSGLSGIAGYKTVHKGNEYVHLFTVLANEKDNNVNLEKEE